MGIYRPLKKCREDQIYWLESAYGGRRIYLCWYTRAGNFGQRCLHRTLLGKVYET